MNHKVHVFINGCLTLKLSASWKTVMFSPLVVLVVAGAAFSLFCCVVPRSPLACSELSTGAGATSAMVVHCLGVDRRSKNLCMEQGDQWLWRDYQVVE